MLVSIRQQAADVSRECTCVRPLPDNGLIGQYF